MARSTAARMRLRRASAVVLALAVAGLLVLISAFVLRGSLAAGGGAAGPPSRPSVTQTQISTVATATVPTDAISVPPLAGTGVTSPAASPSSSESPSPLTSPVVPSTDLSTSVPPPPPQTTPTLALPELDPAYQSILGFHGTEKVVYLTFDDGPGPQTPQVLDVLAANGVLATFCQVGNRIDAYAATEQRIVAAGHTLCNHSWSHPANLDAQPADVINDQISRTQQVQSSYGVTPHYFRAPGGNFAVGGSTTLRQVCQLNGVYPLGWGIDSLDWQEPGVQQIVDNVAKAVSPGAIVLMHDAGGSNRDQTIAALPTIIATLKAAGYEFRPLPPD